MKIKRTKIERISFAKFATDHNLTLELREIELGFFHASFVKTEVSHGYCLSSVYGQGNSEMEAIRDYARRIAGETLIVDAYGKHRTIIKVPKGLS